MLCRVFGVARNARTAYVACTLATQLRTWLDRAVKVRLYAEHGIPEMWLVDLRATQLVRYCNPQQGAYAFVDRPDLGTAIELAAVADYCPYIVRMI